MIDEKKLIEEIENLQQHADITHNLISFYALDNIKKYVENMPKVNEWIPVEVAMPPEHDSIFVKFKGTDKWKDGMFENISDNVQVTVEFENGKRLVDMAHTQDGKWKLSTFKVMKPKKVVAWKPLSLPFDER